jgi:type VI secretion system protein VasD
MQLCCKQFLLGLAVLLLGGCSTVSGEPSTLSKMADLALEAVGMKKPEVPAVPEMPEMQKPPRKVALRLHAGSNLNAGATDTPLSLITRIYKLRQTAAFYATPYDSFLSPEKEKAALGADLIEVREINLVPGQVYEVTETVSREAGYIAVVTMFMSPAPKRWRIAFAAADAETMGITLGLHACSLTLGKGAASDLAKLADSGNAPARCL